MVHVVHSVHLLVVNEGVAIAAVAAASGVTDDDIKVDCVDDTTPSLVTPTLSRGLLMRVGLLQLRIRTVVFLLSLLTPMLSLILVLQPFILI